MIAPRFWARLAFVGTLAFVTWGSLSPAAGELPTADKVTHIIGYAVLGVLAELSFPRRPHYLLKAVPLFLYGVGIEFLQEGIPGRFFEGLDMVSNGIGLFLVWPVIALLTRRR